jgi:hypothetical protein
MSDKEKLEQQKKQIKKLSEVLVKEYELDLKTNPEMDFDAFLILKIYETTLFENSRVNLITRLT